jgi:hypothetical protein
VYSAFFTSVWIWLYLISGFLIKSANYSNSVFKRTVNLFDVKKSPLTVIGFVVSILIIAFSFLFLFGNKIGKSLTEKLTQSTQENGHITRNNNNEDIPWESFKSRYPNLYKTNIYSPTELDTLREYDKLNEYILSIQGDEICDSIFDVKGIFELNKEILLLDYQLAFKTIDTLRFITKFDLINGKSYYPITKDSLDRDWKNIMKSFYKKEDWKSYNLLRIVRTENFSNAEEHLKSYAENPIIDNEKIRKELDEILRRQYYYHQLIGNYLNSQSKNLLIDYDKYVDKISIDSIDFGKKKYAPLSWNTGSIKSKILIAVMKI